MRGEVIGEERGRVTGTRVLPSDGDGPKVVASFEAGGKILGVEHGEMGTYWSVVRPGETLYAEGQGILTTKDGEMIPWVGQGVGRFTGKGAGVSWRGAVCYRASSERFARLNTVAAVFEFEVDENGTATPKVRQWK